jgi:transcriptional regulator with XRE-family HTH domain
LTKLAQIVTSLTFSDRPAAGRPLNSVSPISALERGTNLPSIESLLAISKAFDKKPSEILEGIDF